MKDTTTRRAIELLKAGHDVAQVQAATGLTPSQIAAAAETAGLTRSHTHAQAQQLLELLVWGEQHPAKGVQALAARAKSALDTLAHRRETEAARAAAEAEVKQLREQLAAAEARLRETGGTKARSAASEAVTAARRSADRKERDRIRTWARENGHAVADRGTLPQHIVDAYRQANPVPS